MNENNEQLSQWVLSSRNDISMAQQNWEAIRQAGLADIRRGLEITRIANQRLQALNYLEQTLGQNLPPSMWNDEIIGATGTYLGGTISAFQKESHRLADLYTGVDQSRQDQHTYLVNNANNTEVASGSAIYMAAAIENRFETIVFNYKPIFESAQPNQISSRQQILDDLAGILRAFDTKYTEMLMGSERALQAEGSDHLSQAAHSMRDMFQQLIECFAPAQVVKRQPWFTNTPGAPGGVSRMSRLRYLLYGSGQAFDAKEIEQLDNAAQTAKDMLDLSIARAHDHDPQLKKAEVELAIDQARFSLLEVLKRYIARRNQKAT